MSPTAVALLGFAAWALFLLGLLAVLRTSLVLSGKKSATDFSPTGDDLPGFGRRVTRAHANCYENLPIAATVLLYAIATGATAITDPFAYAFIGSRIAQSTTHLISASRPFVLVRFAFFLLQVSIIAWWVIRLFLAP
jgi:uncharacterized MAPEG superfamily protein